MRIILFLILFVVVVAAMAIMLSHLIREAANAGAESSQDIPKSIKRVSYVALVILMFGICAGALGGI